MRCLLAALLLFIAAISRAEEFDVLVYGATPAGIAAALAAAEEGGRVLLVEPTQRIGGLVTNGLSHTDFHALEGLTGAFLDFSKRVEAHYRETYGADSPQALGNFRGTHAEPKVNLAVFEAMLTAQPRIKVWRGWELEGVKTSSEAIGETPGPRRAIEVALFANAREEKQSVGARVFIDATYEGDLLAAAGVPYRVGREAAEEYGESLAPQTADDQLQAYNFRLCMTRDPANRVAPKAPKGYDREEFAGVLPLLADGRIRSIFSMEKTSIYKAQIPPLPNGKHDINDMSHGPVRLSLPGENVGWPDGEAGFAARRVGATVPFSRTGLRQSRVRIFDEHLRWNVGLLYFLQNDEAVPAKFRDEAREWGWCRDEFEENGHLPEQLYVREARRMMGVEIFTERNTDNAPGDARAVLRRDSIAMGEYGPNCHGTGHEGPAFGGKHTGEFYKAVPPYQIPYGTLVPREVENLLVAGAISSSHVGFCALRLEPIWMSLGQAAGHAAHLAIAKKVPVQQVPLPQLQARLHAAGAATIYFSDVLPGHPDFAAAQWWGTAGGFHGLAPMPEKPRGKQIVGQYSETYPGHDAELERVLDEPLAEHWRKLAGDLGLDATKLPAADGTITRGAWLHAAWALRQK